MKRIILLFSLSIFLFFIYNTSFAQTNRNNEYKIKTVVIDAGHGGKDPGAMSGGHKEKDIALAIAMKLGALINKHYPDVKVIYTRTTDVFIELNKRAEIANKNHADLFISIHCNAAKNRSAKGTETYVLGLHKSEANLAVAKLENQSILYEDNYEENYGGYDPNSPENNIIFSLFQNAFLDQSLILASNIQDCFDEIHQDSRGVRQAGFLVLWRAAMPSVLIETGFITNSHDRSILGSSAGQQKIATAIFNGFSRAKNNIENENNQVHTPVVIKEEIISDNDSDVSNTYVIEQSEQPNNKNNSTSISPDQVIYKVQFMMTTQKVNTNSGKYRNLKEIEFYKEDGRYKYTTGNFTNERAAQSYKAKVKTYGFKDAFIVQFKNGKRVK